MSYKNRSRKEITLPSGAKCFIRKPTAYDFAQLGEIPVGLGESKNLPPTAADVKRGIAVTKMILTRCVSPLTFGSEVLTIVDKDAWKAKDDELSIEELDQDDANTIVNAVNDFAQLTKEAAQKARPFPEKPQDDNGGPPNS